MAWGRNATPAPANRQQDMGPSAAPGVDYPTFSPLMNISDANSTEGESVALTPQ